MRLCKILEVLFKVVPLRPWQGFLIRRHMEHCPLCRARLAGREEARRVLFSEDDIQGLGSFWPSVRTRLSRPVSAPRAWGRALRMRLAAAAATTVLAVALGVLFFRGFTVQRAAPPLPAEEKFEVDYVKVGGEPADSYIVKSREPRMTLVWAGKKSKGGLS
jgi:hypothetical protein